MYNIEWKEHALQNLEKLENSIAKRIIKKVEELSENPFSQDIKRLKGGNYLRLRVGDYRIIFFIEQDRIQIFKVGHRKNIYN
ncbi:type II toxin-antitoxin system RelE/ParE family toxin [Candidatus Pacearchaeota archaeon CG10_big_fil_rev_8_21_14_0_10_30_48]|nr:MAG: type II toxin-antitoxin system RelE/ParE family toxin [Candidatus Pacearchaeota archaeon CG10_big_fil_rev_8_21_14_0_10_30_48]